MLTIHDYARRQAQILRPFLSPEAQVRCDSIGFARAFEHIEKELERVEYAPLMSETLIPFGAFGASPGTKTVTYRVVQQTGAADYLSGGKVNDPPRADVHATEFQVEVVPLGVEYAYDVMELDSVATDPTVRLDSERKQSAIDAVRLKHDEAAAIGSTKLGRTGFINSPSVSVLTASGVFSGLSVDAMIAQIRRVLDAPRVATANIYKADTLVVDDGTWELLNAPRANTDTTVRKWLMENIKELKNIEVWSRLNLANAAGNGPRIIAYKKDPKVVRYYQVMLMKELAPQSRDYEVVIPCYGYTGHTNIRRPKAVAYMDGV